MKLNLAGKKAFVSGSTSGIGYEIAIHLIQEGCKVVINGRRESELNNVALDLGGNAFGIAGDMSNPAEVDAVVTSAISALGGRLDLLVCNVGSGSSSPPGQECYAEWQRVFGLNLWSATNLVESTQDYLSDSNGSIVCISSICGLEVIPGAPITYSVAKAALNAYVKHISRPLATRGIRINAVVPGNIYFSGSKWEDKLKNFPEEVNAMLKTEVPLSSFGAPSDIASLTAWLLSEQSKFVTGSLYVIDGGQHRS
jgi:NAD(P)-dependent dehydrogenase (short-subunit alcohol dehydrogenase family)